MIYRKVTALQVVLMTIIVIVVAETYTRDTEDKLIDDLMANYTSRVRPHGGSNNQVLQVVIDVGILQLIDVDEKNGMVDGFYYMYIQWTDEKLSWNPAHYEDIDLIVPPEESIWAPNIGLNNDVDPALSKSSMTTSFLQLLHTGMVRHSRVVNYRSSCLMSLKYFPFDVQNCTLSFISFYYVGSDLNLTALEASKSIQYENSEFEMLSITSSREINPFHGMITLHYHFLFKRRPAFYLLSMILPCTMITLVAMLAFCIPPESGEKIGLGVTVLLSLSVFLLILSDQMPPMTEIPLIAVYYFGITLVVTLSTSLSVLTSSLHYNAVYRASKVPRWAEKIFLNYLASWLCLRHYAPEEKIQPDELTAPNRHHKSNGKPNPNQVENLEISDRTEGNYQSAKLNAHNYDITTIAEFIRIRDKGQKIGEYITDQWRYLSMVVDRCLFVVFVLLNAVFTIWVILQTSLGGRK